MVEDQNELLILLGELFYHESKFPHFLEALLLPGDLTESGLHTHTAQLANGEKWLCVALLLLKQSFQALKLSL